jgi:putative protease
MNIYKNKAVEIMAPAGNFSSLTAAWQGGANSVYFGIEKLNMRAGSSKNFTTEDLPEIAAFCKKHNMHSYLAVNTVIYDEEIPVMQEIIDAAKAADISAVIASDQSVINYASKAGMEIHLSTQLNVSNTETVKFYAQYADVMVLARELKLKQIRQIIQSIEKEKITGPSGELIRIEVFAHGALCMAISGKCYLSLHEHDSSANRGACLQTCRKSYTATNNETGYQLEIDNEYIMSPKDLSTIGFLDKLLAAGVSVLKIEGRARPAEYVKTVSECYREAVQAIREGSYSKEKIDAWTKRLSLVFNRGFWEGYYMGKHTGEWSKTYGSKAVRTKKYIGKASNYFSKLGVGEFILQAGRLKPGEKVLISGPTTGIIETKVKEIRLDRDPVNEVVKGQRFSMPVPDKIRPSDKLYTFIYKNQEHDE